MQILKLKFPRFDAKTLKWVIKQDPNATMEVLYNNVVKIRSDLIAKYPLDAEKQYKFDVLREKFTHIPALKIRKFVFNKGHKDVEKLARKLHRKNKKWERKTMKQDHMSVFLSEHFTNNEKFPLDDKQTAILIALKDSYPDFAQWRLRKIVFNNKNLSYEELCSKVQKKLDKKMSKLMKKEQRGSF